MPAAQIKLVGTDYSAQTNNQGQFRFGFLPEGTYRVSYGSATLDMLGYVPPLVEVTLQIDQPQFVILAIPPISRLWSSLCPGRAIQGVGIVSGFVRDSASLRPVPGAQVLVSEIGLDTERPQSGSVVGESITDWAGHFRVCDVPGNEEYAVEARRAGSSAVIIRSTTSRWATMR